MNNYANVSRWLSFALLSLSSLLSSPVSAAFIVSSETGCLGSDTYAYHFSETSIAPDYTVNVVTAAVFADITMTSVSDPRQADLIIVDSFSKAGMKVCKTSFWTNGVKTINVSKTAVVPDITVQLSETSLFPDYKIFVQSKIFTKEEAAALFAVIWKANRKK